MQRTPLRKLITIGVTLVLLSVSILSVVVIARARQNAPYVLTNQVAPLVSRARLVGLRMLNSSSISRLDCNCATSKN